MLFPALKDDRSVTDPIVFLGQYGLCLKKS